MTARFITAAATVVGVTRRVVAVTTLVGAVVVAVAATRG